VDVSVIELHNAGNTEAQQKEALAYLLAQSAPGKAATGVLSGLVVSQTATASGSVLVAAGGAVAQAAVLDGASVLVNDSTATLDVFTANPMGSLPRNDVVVFDAATLSVRVVVGTPNATPTDPTVPTSAVKLARLRNAANATTIPTSAIDDLRTYTALMQSQAPAAVNPFVDYSRGTGGSVPVSAWTRLAYTITNSSEGGIVYSAGDFTVPTAGLYECRAQNMFVGSAGLTVIGALISVDGSTTKGFSYASAASTGNWSVLTSRTLRLTAGQKVSFSAYQNASAAIPTQPDPNATWCQIRRVGD
jgi:hypothetical protein